MKRFAIGIPTLNRWDLLAPALNKYIGVDFAGVDIYIIDNGHQGIKGSYSEYPNVHIHEAEKNLGVAASWNLLCKEIFEEHEFALILNDDIYLGQSCDLIRAICSENVFWTCPNQWCVFLFSINIYEKVGPFDEKFYPAYFEDSDYAYRLKLANAMQESTSILLPEIYRRSSSLEKDPSINDNFKANLRYFQEKWGGNPGSETFVVPFNQYTLTDAILKDMGFRPSPLSDNQWITTFNDYKGINQILAIDRLVFPEGNVYKYMIRSTWTFLNYKEPWYRILKTKKDVQDLVLGLTGNTIA